MKVLKFGGSSVSTPERIREVKRIIESQPLPGIIVISAFQGVTDQLYTISELASSGNTEYEIKLRTISEKHIELTKN